MKKDAEKIIRPVAIVFSCIATIPALMAPMSTLGDFLLKLILFVYCSLVFWTTLRVWAALTIYLFSLIASLQFYLMISELWTSPRFWWNTIMYGEARGAQYYGNDGQTGDLLFLVIHAVLAFGFGLMAAFGFWAYLKMRSKQSIIAPSVLLKDDQQVATWVNYVRSLDREKQVAELKRLNETNPEFYKLVNLSLCAFDNNNKQTP